ncbi:hypothetical protein PENTCL1PPCAC_26252 [Pristionchus entomophagus]|uniref:PDZ domain-containing protein n=1 Tax=Pristionchus entomophagus TaxID=358040 RepID=A0AAV5UCF2_9BILA|nr:hypothetical protein PENTCL1PPCAC_26252 [Pristionchus entomophagus]
MSFFSCIPSCNRQIDSLDKRQTNLQTIPHEIGRYSRSLEELLLDMNHIKGLENDSVVFRLSRLRILGLSDNDIYKVPAEIAKLGSLEELNLSKNDISDLPDEIRDCKGLTRLELSSNPFTRLPQAISQLTSLTYLGLNEISLTQLPADIGNLTNLRSLEARDNLLRTLPISICQLIQLRVLDLGCNEIDNLPSDMGSMASLEELYVDTNELETLPDQLILCRNLEQLDVSDNKLNVLPEELGELSRLTDLNVSNNNLSEFPNSIGKLRRLSILKAEKNTISRLTSAIGTCDQLTELFLTENLLTELPSSIGNLRHLRTLNADKNSLLSIPTTIGGCCSLSVLSLRDNALTDLPMDIGKCEAITVLDVCSNRLSYLPFTIKVLFKLQALWLSENQPQSLLKLQEEREARTGVKVLTCYLLPQESAAQAQEPERGASRSFLGGPKVHFPDDKGDTTMDEENKLPIGEFHRHDTPHPKPHAGNKLKKNTIDGHVIHHEDDSLPTSSLALKKKPSDALSPSPSTTSAAAAAAAAPPPPMPRSALRQFAQPDKSPSQRGVTSPVQQQQMQQDNNNQWSTSSSSRSVLFAPPPSSHHPPPSSSSLLPPVCSSGGGGTGLGMDEPPRLKRINTPHYKSIRASQESATSSSGGPKIRRIRVLRDSSGNLGLSIAGGLESTPFREDDRGLFVSKVVEGGPAERAGLRVGDKLLRVNETDVLHVAHETAVRAMKEGREKVELSVLRMDDDKEGGSGNEERIGSTPVQTPIQTPDVSFSEGDANSTKDILSITIKRDKTGSPGFAVAGAGAGRDGIFISSITRGGAADLEGKLMVGDRVVSIDGTKMKGALHDQAVALLTGMAGKDVHLVLHRDRPSHLSPLPSSSLPLSHPPTPSTPLLPSSSSIRSPSPISSPVYMLGDASWDGKMETVSLHREGASLGLSVVGGADHVSHPFGVEIPGVFISKIAAGSAADRSRRLRIGDRIIQVNDVNVETAKHATAVEALKASGSSVRLVVCHDAQPTGMREVVVRRRGDGPLGMSIHGGVNALRANPAQPDDEGIFIDRVEPSSISERAGLVPGQRIIEVNGESLLGATQEEAAASLKKAHELRLLLCDGYNRGAGRAGAKGLNGFPAPLRVSSSHLASSSPPSVPPPPTSSASSGVGMSLSSPLDVEVDATPSTPLFSPNGDHHHHHSSPVSPILSSHELSTTRVDELVKDHEGVPLAASSPLPATITKASKLPPPPVAPKPTLRTSQAPNVTAPSGKERTPECPERLAFSSKLSHFEKKMEEASMIPRPTSVPEKKRLLNDDDIARLREAEEQKRLAEVMASPLRGDEKDHFLAMIEESQAVRGPGSIRTKKAERRAIVAGLIEDENGELSESERLEREAAKRDQWRKERLASVVSKQHDFDAILNSVQPILKTMEETNEKGLSTLDEIQYADEEL